MLINPLAHTMVSKFCLKNRIFPVFFYVLFHLTSAFGQSTCTLAVDAGNNIAICSPSIVQLHGTTSAAAGLIQSISWFPLSGLSNPTILSPTANVSSPITYYLTVNAIGDSNM